jgi:hypothetical protein
MRNIWEYPLRADEVMHTLKVAQEEYASKQTYGGVNGLVLHQLMEFLKNEENMNSFLEFSKLDKS